MLADVLRPPIPDLQLLTVTTTGHAVTLELAATARAACCPCCQHASSRVHSHYCRHPTDLPAAGHALHLVLHVRRFFCDNPACVRRIFTERLGPTLRASARRTTRLAEQLQSLALTVGATLGAAVATLVGMPTSASSLLRLIRASLLPQHPTPSVLGIDDWSRRKGQHFGTILVDLETHTPVDLLPDREAASVAAWLQGHPGVQIISRDRASGYAEGATLGAPAARQVADKFHLTQNLGDALQRLLDRYPGLLQQVTERLALQAAGLTGVGQSAATTDARPAGAPAAGAGPVVAAAPAGPDEGASPKAEPAVSTPPAPAPATEATRCPVPARTQQRFAAVKALQEQGLGQRAIARRLGLHRRTVRRYLVADQAPARGAGHQAQSTVRPYLPYLRRRWSEGCRNRLQLWEELRAQGSGGSYASVYRALVRVFGVGGSGEGRARGTAAAAAPLPRAVSVPEVRPLTARSARWLFLRRPEELDPQEQEARDLLIALSPAVAQAAPLVRQFLQMVRERRGEDLDAWLADALASAVGELRNFAKGVQRDYAAVREGLTTSVSQDSGGPGESA